MTERLNIGAALGGMCFLFHVCCSVYPPQAFGLVGSPTTDQRLRCIVFFFFFDLFFCLCFLFRIGMLCLPAALFPPTKR